VCEVRDTGIGIAPADQEKIFEPFVHDVQSRTEISEEGAGLGLSLVKAALKAHGGDVKLSSTVGEGAVFTVVFHECTPEHQESPDRPSPDREAQHA
jgi:signal transduction histidine kinase